MTPFVTLIEIFDFFLDLSQWKYFLKVSIEVIFFPIIFENVWNLRIIYYLFFSLFWIHILDKDFWDLWTYLYWGYK